MPRSKKQQQKVSSYDHQSSKQKQLQQLMLNDGDRKSAFVNADDWKRVLYTKVSTTLFLFPLFYF